MSQEVPEPTDSAWKPLTLQDAMQNESVWYLITQRDQFASAALTKCQFVAMYGDEPGDAAKRVAAQAYGIADALLARRKVQP